VSTKQGAAGADAGRMGAVIVTVEPEGRQRMALREAGGRTLLGHVVAAVGRLTGRDTIVAIVDQGGEAALATMGIQLEKLQAGDGFGQALGAAVGRWEGLDSVVVIAGDVARIQPETLEELAGRHGSDGAAMTMAKIESGESGPHGAAVCVVKTALLRAHLELKAADLESAIAQLADALRAAGRRVVEHTLKAPASEVERVRTIPELVDLDRRMRIAKADKLMAEGVTIFLPETCVIDAEVEVGAETVIEPFVQLRGKTKIGARSRIRSYSVIENCEIGSRVLVLPGCIMADSTVGDGARLGPYSHLRPGCAIGEDAHVGNFVETKKARLGKGAKANHLTYLGDVEVGAKTNIGAGVITCNYDGMHKHLTRIGEGVFVGSDTTLVAPVTLEDGAYVGAGSCITKDVPAGALAVGRARQVIKEGWAEARRERQKSQK
jgi:bifunctional UDP-N-acetylglucosamine pyrophosphorylase / glucosamine-1-phosphate N-acetyltransferase